MTVDIDVLCAGFACYDLVFGVERHPKPDEKIFAERFQACGGGPAANAAVAAARLGARCAFAGYLGNDLYGLKHLAEFEDSGVFTDLVATGDAPTPLSAILVKPDGRRTVINFKGDTAPLAADAIDVDRYRPRVILFDGHQPDISGALVEKARRGGALTVLDAGSLNPGTERLVRQVDYVVASEAFASSFSGQGDPDVSAERIHQTGAAAVITLGADGVVWRTGQGAGRLPAFAVDVLDTTGAGDTFHGAFAAALAQGAPWLELLHFASAAAALCCCRLGARPGIPSASALREFLRQNPQPAAGRRQGPDDG